MSSTTDKTTRVRGRVRVEHGANASAPTWAASWSPTRPARCSSGRSRTTRPTTSRRPTSAPSCSPPTDGVAHSPSRGDGAPFTVRAGGKEAAGAALRYEQSPFEELRDAIRLDWNAMDAWFEEDEQVFTHPRDPYTRVDILPSSRHVRVEVDGVTIAETTKPTLLFETGLPVRYYLPKTHVRMDLLTPTESVSHCPYKGDAEYWSLRDRESVHADLAWSYRTPLPESQKIAGLISFYTGRRSTSTSTESSRLDPGRVSPSIRFSSTQAIRRSSSTRSRTGSSPPTRPAASCSATRREELLETPVSRIHPGELEQLQAFVGSRPRARTRLHDHAHLPHQARQLACRSSCRSGHSTTPAASSCSALVHDRSEHRQARADD